MENTEPLKLGMRKLGGQPENNVVCSFLPQIIIAKKRGLCTRGLQHIALLVESARASRLALCDAVGKFYPQRLPGLAGGEDGEQLTSCVLYHYINCTVLGVPLVS